VNVSTKAETSNEVPSQMVAILEDMTGDWDLELDKGIDLETQLIRDLEFESIDIVEMVVTIEQKLGKRNIPFEELLMVDGRYVDDLSVGQIADFVARYV
jgi:acyl carrier protein